MKHTPGPWRADFGEAIRIKDAQGNTICTVTHLTKAGRRKASEVEANAKLVAAAPELLEDLEDRLSQTHCGCEHPACRRCLDDSRTRAVIANAKGEST